MSLEPLKLIRARNHTAPVLLLIQGFCPRRHCLLHPRPCKHLRHEFDPLQEIELY